MKASELSRLEDEIVRNSGARAACFVEGKKLVVLAEHPMVRAGGFDEARKRVAAALPAFVLARPYEIEVVRPGRLKNSRAANAAAYRRRLEARRAPRLIVPEFRDDLTPAEKDAFGFFGGTSKILTPLEVKSPPAGIEIGNWVSLGRYGRIELHTNSSRYAEYAKQHYPEAKQEVTPRVHEPRTPRIRIGDGSTLGDFFFLSCAKLIEIGRHVTISSRFFVTDCHHHYENLELPISLQGNSLGTPVVIEDHAWLGINATVLEGVRIGKHSIVGANSVVTQDVEPFTIVGGNPARFIRRITERVPARNSTMPG